MMSRCRHRLGAVILACALLSACGGSTPATGATPNLITIQNFAFSPENLDVKPGATVTVRNMDTVPHSVTSQSAPHQYVPGAVAGIQFDTGQFTGERTFTIPANATPGTVVPYFCTVHKGGMTNDGQITIQSP